MMLETMVLLVFSFLLGIGSLIVAAWLVVSHQFATIDGLFLALVCLVLALVFFLNCGWSLKSQEFREWQARRLKPKE
jgi:hypothetical protein